ncbi:hypothetical protein Tco_0404609 [Tanacetum coccineum]
MICQIWKFLPLRDKEIQFDKIIFYVIIDLHNTLTDIRSHNRYSSIFPNRQQREYQNDGSLAILTLDFLNAFNLVYRSALLHEQGDPLGPLLFALILHPLLHKIKDSCKLLLHAWYLDDGTVIGDSEEVVRVLDIIKLREGLFPVDIRRPSLGVKLLGGAVSRGAYFISGLAMRRAANAVDLMGLLSYLILGAKDHILRDSGICGMDDDYVSVLACLRDTIPSFDFSGFTNKDTVPSKAQQTLANVLFSKMVKDMEVGGKHACVDLIGVSPLVGLSSRGFTAGQTALKAASGKVIKHEKACIENQHVFIPFAFDTFGFLAPEAVELLNRVQRVMHSNVMTPRPTYVVFKRIGFAIQKGLAAHLVARLSSTTI